MASSHKLPRMLYLLDGVYVASAGPDQHRPGRRRRRLRGAWLAVDANRVTAARFSATGTSAPDSAGSSLAA